MMNFACGCMFSHGGLLYSPRPDVSHLPVKKPIPIGGDTSANQLPLMPIPPNYRTAKDWTAIAWPTNIQSKTPDGKFGPVKEMRGWQDCWFLASLSAVANDPDGHKILVESIRQVDGGYEVMFMGVPNNNVFVSYAELQEPLETEGGDADTRIIELAADKLLNKIGNYKSLFIATLMEGGWDQKVAEQCFYDSCGIKGSQTPLTYNPMRSGSTTYVAFFMLTGKYPDILVAPSDATMQTNDIMRFLDEYVSNDRDGVSVTINGLENPLGESDDSRYILLDWDVIRTEITSNRTMDPQQQAFLNALEKWLAIRDSNNFRALSLAADNLKLQQINPTAFVDLLARNQFKMSQKHFNLLRSGVLEVLRGGPGYIGFTGKHAGTIEGINKATNTFTYCESNNPTLVYTGKLSGLIQALESGKAFLTALEPTTGRNARGPFEHAGSSRGRHLRQIHNQVVGDGKIDQVESGPLANLLEMDDGAFRQVYDGDRNGVIEGGELKAVQLRVDQWLEHLALTPLW